MKGNLFAYSMMVLWPLIAIWLYRTRTIQVATLWTILGGLMFLPVRTVIDFPFIPPLGKNSIPVISAFIGIWLIKRKKLSFRSHSGWVRWLLILFIVSPVFTALLNGDTVNVGGNILPSLGIHDGISMMINRYLLILPLIIGSQLFRSYESQLLMFKVLVIAGLIYSLPILYEIRMSPELHTLLYGYFPHSWIQQKRFGGFRPVVFIGHGLLVAFFTMVVLLSATALSKNGEKIRKISATKISYYFFIVLVLCKSLAPIIYGVVAFVAIKYASTKLQIRLAVFLALLTVFYPVMSITKIFPHQTITNLAADISEDRADSLQFRFDNEKMLLEHSRERLWFGWGGWGRNRVHSKETGADLTVSDGQWIITFSQFGVFGFIAEFGLLSLIVFRSQKAAKYLTSKPEQRLLAAHTLLVALIMTDQIPNASLSPWLWLLAGILLGRSEYIIAQNKLQT